MLFERCGNSIAMNSRQQPQSRIGFDECADDAQVRKPAGPHEKGCPLMRNRYVDANSFAPSMFMRLSFHKWRRRNDDKTLNLDATIPTAATARR